MGFTPLSQTKKSSFTPLSEATAALSSSQRVVDQSKVFTSPLHTIASGGNLAAGPVGALKGLASDLSSAGAQNAGPIGKGMLSHSPAMQQGIEGLSTALAPQNTEEAVGAGQNTAVQLGLGGMGLLKGARTLAEKVGLIAPKGEKEVRALSEALNPELTGKRLDKAYQTVGTGQRTATPRTLFREGSLDPDERTVELATRLKGTLKGKKSLDKLDEAATSFTKTEKEIDDLLNADPSLVYNANKPDLYAKFNELDTEIPQEFQAIKDSKAMFNQVTNYARKLASEAEDTPKGIREARKKFDVQSKTEFPSAYGEDGRIDQKTPAGRAIKATRDLFNEHFYETAPEGSAIKEKVLHEADLYRAIERLAPKAKTEQELSGIRELIKKHPIIATILGSALGTGAFAEVKERF